MNFVIIAYRKKGYVIYQIWICQKSFIEFIICYIFYFILFYSYLMTWPQHIYSFHARCLSDQGVITAAPCTRSIRQRRYPVISWTLGSLPSLLSVPAVWPGERAALASVPDRRPATGWYRRQCLCHLPDLSGPGDIQGWVGFLARCLGLPQEA